MKTEFDTWSFPEAPHKEKRKKQKKEKRKKRTHTVRMQEKIKQWMKDWPCMTPDL